MCGIGGIVTFGGREVRRDLLVRMLARLRHRGPDEFGIYRDGRAGLAHARLSIIDLSTGSQPIASDDGNLWIVYNGELFDYLDHRRDLESRGVRFRTQSDTEVVLRLYEHYGKDALQRMNGQFAFAVWDARNQVLFLARDRVGICPLFYARAGGDFVFASECKAILSDDRIGRRIDAVALDDVCTFWFPLSPRTAFQGVYEVPPAHFMTVSSDAVRTHRYWDFPTGEGAERRRRDSDYLEELESLLDDAVGIRLRSDVEVGSYLSGGIDSSIVTAMALSRSDGKMRTYSLRFEDAVFDEGDKQRIVSRHLGIPSEEVVARVGDIASVFEEVIWHAEVPIARTAPAPLFLLSRLVHERGGKVVLTGEGADEFLAGYDIFRESKVRRFVARNPESRIRPALLGRLYPYMDRSPAAYAAFAKAFFGAPIKPFSAPFYSHAPRWNITSTVKAFYSRDLTDHLAGSSTADRVESLLDVGRIPSMPPLNWEQEIEAKTLLPSYLLSTQGDRMLLGNSVEGRFPFLDHRLIELALRTPPSLRLRGLTEKWALRRIASRHLPPEITSASKQPYRAPDANCFSHGVGAALADYFLEEGRLREAGYFDTEKVSFLRAKCQRGGITGFRDNTAVVIVLSTMILHELFVRSFHPPDPVPPERIREYGPGSGRFGRTAGGAGEEGHGVSSW